MTRTSQAELKEFIQIVIIIIIGFLFIGQALTGLKFGFTYIFSWVLR